MTVRVSYAGKNLDKMFSQSKMSETTYVVANQVMADMDKFVPYKQGHLAGSAHIDSNRHTIVYDTPYAKAQFYGFITNYKTGKQSRIRNYTRTEHPQASRRWDLRAKGLYMDKWLNTVSGTLLGGHYGS